VVFYRELKNLRQKYLLGKQLGEGGNAHVHIIHEREDPKQKFALKRWNCHPDDWRFNKEYQNLIIIQKEVVVHSMLGDCENIVEVNWAGIAEQNKDAPKEEIKDPDDVWPLFSEPFFYMIMPLLIPLTKFLGNRKESEFKQNQKSKIIFDIAKGINFLHSCKIIHRDMKPENVLLEQKDGTFVAKLCDIGCARFISKEKITIMGTPAYFAPEIIKGRIESLSEFNEAVDIFACGLLFWEVDTQQRIPWDQLKPRTNNCFNSEELSIIQSEQLRLVISSCIQIDPENRIKASDLYKTCGEIYKIHFSDYIL